MSSNYPVGGGSKRKKKTHPKKVPTPVCTQQWNPDDFGLLREEVRRLHNFSDNMERLKMEKAKEMSISTATMSIVFVLLLLGIIVVTCYGFTQIFMAVHKSFYKK